MKTIPGVLAGLTLLAAAAPAAAQHGGFHGDGGFHGGGFHGGGFHGGFHGFRGGRFHDGHFRHVRAAPFFGFGLGLGLAYGYPWWGYPAYDDLYPYPYPAAYAQPDTACGTWIWHPETRSYGWLACGATAEVNVPVAAPPTAPPAAEPPAPAVQQP